MWRIISWAGATPSRPQTTRAVQRKAALITLLHEPAT
jgi:hypothetical protein